MNDTLSKETLDEAHKAFRNDSLALYALFRLVAAKPEAFDKAILDDLIKAALDKARIGTILEAFTTTLELTESCEDYSLFKARLADRGLQTIEVYEKHATRTANIASLLPELFSEETKESLK